jgi:dTDP-4-dehydrorhamnose reductase
LRVVVTGASGQVGRALRDSAPASAQFHALAREQLDVSDAAAVHKALAEIRPGLVINAAAYTAVDRAETEAVEAAAVNSAGARFLALAVQAIEGARLLHVSTDYVFDGLGTAPYRPNDSPHPLSAYGRTKLAGERAVQQVLAERAVVLRSAWIYAPAGHNFVLTMLRLMRERGAVRVVSDQRGTPTAAASVARALWRLAELPEVHGILHWTDEGSTSWYEFACAIAEEARALGLLQNRVEVTPITTAEYPTPARRPPNSVLDIGATATRLGLRPVPWREMLRTTLRAVTVQPGARS